MRILMLHASPLVTGPAELCLDDAAALRAAGHEVLFGVDTRREGDYAAAVRRAGFELMEELALCRKSGPLEIARDLVRLRARLGSADLVHCRFSHDHSLALAAAKGLARRPAIVRTAETARTLRPGALRGLSFRSSEAVVVSCEGYARILREAHRVPAARVHVLPGRVDAARFCPGDGSALRTELGIGPGELLFGIVARIKPDRLHERVLRGFARAARELPRARLALVGRGEGVPETRALVAALGLGDRVLFAGYRTGDALVAAYRAFDAKVWIAEGNDGTCRAVLEAMACGTPVIAGDKGAMAESVRDGVEGRVVPAEPEAIARAMVEIVPRLAGMRPAARARALEFTAARRAEGLARIYAAARGQ